MQTHPDDVAAAAAQVAERALRRAAGVGPSAPVRLLASDQAGLDAVDGGAAVTRTTSVWELARATWRVVVDAAPAGEPDGEPRLTVVEVADAAAPGRGARGWDEQYRADAGPTEPHPAVVEALGSTDPGSALDIACGTGRHSLWLAEKGWQVTGLDFSRVGLATLASAAAARGVQVRTEVADARTWSPPGGTTYDLVLMSFVHLPEVIASAARWVAPGGRMLVVGASTSTAAGTGPSDPRLRLDRVDLAARVTGARLRVVRAAEVEREVPQGTRTDVVLLATKPAVTP